MKYTVRHKSSDIRDEIRDEGIMLMHIPSDASLRVSQKVYHLEPWGCRTETTGVDEGSWAQTFLSIRFVVEAETETEVQESLPNFYVPLAVVQINLKINGCS